MKLEVIESKYPIICGGFFGFLSALMLGVHNGINYNDLFLNLSIGALIGGFLAKIFVFMLAMSIKHSSIDKLEKIKMDINTPGNKNNSGSTS